MKYQIHLYTAQEVLVNTDCEIDNYDGTILTFTDKTGQQVVTSLPWLYFPSTPHAAQPKENKS